MTDETATPARWAIVEQMGYLKAAGRISEEEMGGSKLIRLDVPTPDGGFMTKYIGGSSIYQITIVTEEVARGVQADLRDPRPVNPSAFATPRIGFNSGGRPESVFADDADWDDIDEDAQALCDRDRE